MLESRRSSFPKSRMARSELFLFECRAVDADACIERLRVACTWMTWNMDTQRCYGFVQFRMPNTLISLCKFTKGRVFFAPQYVRPAEMSHTHGEYAMVPFSFERRSLALMQECNYSLEQMLQKDMRFALRIAHSIHLQPGCPVLVVRRYTDLKNVRWYHREVRLTSESLAGLQEACNMSELLEQNGRARCIAIRYKTHLYNTFALIHAHTHVFVDA